MDGELALARRCGCAGSAPGEEADASGKQPDQTAAIIGGQADAGHHRKRSHKFAVIHEKMTSTPNGAVASLLLAWLLCATPL